MRTVRFVSPEPNKNIDFCVPVLLPIMLGILSKTLYNPDTPFAVLEPCLYSKHIGSMTSTGNDKSTVPSCDYTERG